MSETIHTSTPSRPRAVCVLGMHRSGTSVMTSLLERLGVYLGDAGDFLDPLPENARGYWEHRGFKDLNEALLARLGGQWHTPPAFPPGWERAPQLDDLRTQAEALIRDGFGARELWGWKDPRTSLTLPFWRPLLPQTCFIVCLRNPLDVARSLQVRDGLPIAHGMRLWLAYTAAALAHTADQPRLFLSYERIVSAPEAAAMALAGAIGRATLAPGTAATLVAPDLRHHCTPAIDLMADRAQPFPATSLYAILRIAESGPGDADTQALVDACAAAAVDAQAVADRTGGEADVILDDLQMARQVRALAYEASARAERESDPARRAAIFDDLRAALPRPGEAPDVTLSGTVRSRLRDYLSRHQALAIAYRRGRRLVRHTLRLGP